ncbi:ATP-binding cassette domain-containing protein [Nakamurella sp.]|uniref:ATP-binding cassette domain-containing protein n=1 Tax=Nakamurella sp. TaxID=1869182 RepID=UPI003B3BAAE7
MALRADRAPRTAGTVVGRTGRHPDPSTVGGGGHTAAALEITGLTIRVSAITPVAGLDLRIPAGGRLALLGASGSGKSLTAAAVAGCLPAGAGTGGSVRVGGIEVLDRPTARRPAGARVGLVVQDSATALNPMVTVGRQVRQPLVRRGRSRAAATGELSGLLAAVGIEDPARILASHPGALSGGQRQRVCLALALACEVGLLVADEPTTALDVVTQAAVLDLLRDRTGGTAGPALLFITHDIAVAAALCDEIAVMDAGVVVEQGPAGEILGAPAHPVTRRLIGSARDIERDLLAAVAAAMPAAGRA